METGARAVKRWGGAKAQAWTRAVLARYGTECQLRLPVCTGEATTGDHIEPYSQRPDLAYVVSNGRPACLPCNQARGTTPLAAVVVVDELGLFERR